MTRRYVVFLAAPILLAAVFGVQALVSALRSPRPRLAFSYEGRPGGQGLLSQAAKASDVARLTPGPMDALFSVPGIVVWDRGFLNPPKEVPGGGSPWQDLETLKDLAWSGSSVLLAYHGLADTLPPGASRDLAETAGLEGPEWIGAYVRGLGWADSVPRTVRQAWKAQTGQAWDFQGDGIFLQRLRDGKVLVLRRGIELGKGALRVKGQDASGPDGYYSGWFCVARPRETTAVRASFVLDLLEPGKALASANGLAEGFPALSEQGYGRGRVWAMLGDFAGPATASELPGPLPAPQVEKLRTLDSPGNSIAIYQRILVPMVGQILASTTGAQAQAAMAAPEFRSGSRYLERRDSGGQFRPWFVQGVDLGASVPGTWATEPPTDDGAWLEALKGIQAAGFDSVRVYTLLPPAFYRALARLNTASKSPLFLFQGIWLDEDPPGRDLLDPAWYAEAMAESDLCEDALHGRASIPSRSGKSWGEYRVDVSPWLAAFLVGRELVPEEVEATAKAHPDYSWTGRHFTVSRGYPVESFLASWADRVQARELGRYRRASPVGFVSWPTLDPLHHPGEWTEGSDKAPYHDRSMVDLRSVSLGPDEKAGFFAAFHIYPNYPDFMTRDSAYDRPDPTGMARYGAYISDLLRVLPRVPLIVAEFGLSTGYGTAHLHPEGLDHGGLREADQALGLARMFRVLAQRGTGGGMVFEWSDEWSKKTWNTETYMIPYARHQLWHNEIDPEQNYGIVDWESPSPLAWTDQGSGLRTAGDPDFLYLSLDTGVERGKSQEIELGIDVVPGRTGQYRLSPGGPLSPQGSEFKVRITRRPWGPSSATLLVSADYDRASGFLFPRESDQGGFTTMSSLVNNEITSQEGIHFPALREEGSRLALDTPTSMGLAGLDPEGWLVLRLPWSRLNFSDPSSGTILLDARPGTQYITLQDSIGTRKIDSLGLWASVRTEGSEEARLLPAADKAWRVDLRTWESLDVRPRPKPALKALSELLHSWKPLELAP